jgi:putative copper export protein
VWGWVHAIHLLCAALWIGVMAGDLLMVTPLLKRVDLPSRLALVPRVLKVNAAVGWASVTFLTITGLALTFRWVPIERYESPYGRFFLAKLVVVAVLFLVYVMFYSGRQQRLKGVLEQHAREGMTAELEGTMASHLRRLDLYIAIDLALAVLVVLLIEMAAYA